jgi:hypothetical protein
MENDTKVLPWFAAGLVVTVVVWDILIATAPDTDIQSNQIDTAITTAFTKQVKRTEQQLSLIQPHNDSIPQIQSQLSKIEHYLINDNFIKAKHELIDQAASFYNQNDLKNMAYVLALIGKLSTEASDTAGAELFLTEALDVFTQINEPLGKAYSYMQLGRMHIKSRSIAREAAGSYDRLLIARNQITRYQYPQALDNLNIVIDESLSMKRYATAAAALGSLARLHRLTGNIYEADQALLKSAEQYAISGRSNRAVEIIQRLSLQGIDHSRLILAEKNIQNALKQFDQDSLRIREAQDIQQLYNHYRSKGDHQRAWHLRIKAAKTLAKASKRAIYYKQSDVMTILYNSNKNMAMAENYVRHATDLFGSVNESKWQATTKDLTVEIF